MYEQTIQVYSEALSPDIYLYVPEVISAILDDVQVVVLVVLQLGDDPEDVVHLDLPLTRLHAARMRVRHVDVDEVGEIEAEVGGARHVLHGDAVHVVPQSREVLRLREQLGELVEGALVLYKYVSQGFTSVFSWKT